MSRNYDNWERLVEAVIKKQQIWELCHQPSRTPSICSECSSLSDLTSVFQSDLHPIPKILAIEGALRSTREVGKGRFGTCVLTELHQDVPLSDHQFLHRGTQLVMKKLVGKVIVTEEEFSTVVGNCRHENVAAPRAFYFSTNQNFIFSDYYIRGSANDMLDGRKSMQLDSPNRSILLPNWTNRPKIANSPNQSIRRPDWTNRLKIAIGAARGVAYIHSQNMAHGNLNTSNIFVNSDDYGCVSDFGLAGMIKMPKKRVDLRYHASVHEFKNPSQEGDVYSFGVVLLELVIGRTSVELTPGVRKTPLEIAELALSVGSQEWSSKLSMCCNLGGFFCDELDMLQCLQGKFNGDRYLREYLPFLSRYLELISVEQTEAFRIAKRCLAYSPQHRSKMFEVVLMLQNVVATSK